MLERWITAVQTEDPGLEEPADTRTRLKDAFPRNATRRMTQLGLLVGATLGPVSPRRDDTLVYASGYAETRALEGYLDSFPTASPTLFQTSIHPSAVQQTLIGRQQEVGRFYPLTGGEDLPARALQVALLAGTPRCVICGGEERGTWLLQQRVSSTRAFAFAMALESSAENPLGRIILEFTGDSDEGGLALDRFFDLLHTRQSFNGLAAPGRRLRLEWK